MTCHVSPFIHYVGGIALDKNHEKGLLGRFTLSSLFLVKFLQFITVLSHHVESLFCNHSGITSVGQFSRKCAKLINQA